MLAKIGKTLVLLVFFLCTASPVAEITDSGKTLTLKAAYLFNLLKFTSWPDERFENDSSPIRVAIPSNNAVGVIFKKASGRRKAGGRTVEAVRYNSGEELKAVVIQCHVVFVGSEYIEQMVDIYEMALRSDTLLVGDAKEITKKGGMVEIGLDENGERMEFRFNIEELKRTDITISSKLIRLSKTVSTVP